MTHDDAQLASETLGLALGRALASSHEIAALGLDEALRILHANPVARRALGLQADRQRDPRLHDLVEREDHQRLAADLDGGTDLPGPYLLRRAGRPDDPDAALLVSVLRVETGGAGCRIVLLGRSAGPEVLREARVLRARRLEIVGQLAAGIAHEINNRLSTVTTFSDLLLGDTEPGSQGAEDLAEIKQAGLDSAVITRKLDLFSGGRAGGAPTSDAAAVVVGLEKLIRRFVPESVTVRIDAASDLPEVPAPPIRLEEIVFALVANARDAMPDGGTLNVRVSASEQAGRAAVVLEISDTGDARDVPPLAWAVQPFFSSRSAFASAGLGLTTVLGIVEGLGGTLEMHARPGSGTTVRVEIPTAVAHTARATDSGQERASEAPNAGLRLALSEPDPALRAALRRVLEQRGARVDEGGSVAELVSDRVPAALIADVPDEAGAGMRTVEAARSRWSGVPIVLLRRRSTLHEFGPEHPGVTEVAKPVDLAALMAALERAVHSAAPAGSDRTP